MNWAEKTVLITGGTGSFGREFASLVLAEYRPKKIIIFSRDEMKQFAMKSEGFDAGPIRYFIGDVRDKDRLYRAFYGVDIVVHAAAMKQVPTAEYNPFEAIKTNVIGAANVIDAAIDCGVERVIALSTDKAAHPKNVMGATKRVGELIVSCRPATTMRCISVRFGNVLGSNGSVIPVLQEQIRTGQELTLTHSAVRRFFMTIHEAVSLVLEAFTIGGHGEVLVLDMGRPVHIVDLARTLIRLSGKSTEEVKIRFTGLRPGEKLCEELFYPGERVAATRYPKIRSARGEMTSWTSLQSQLIDLQRSLLAGNDAVVRDRLMSIVSAGFYRPSSVPARSIRSEKLAQIVLHRAASQN